MADVETYLLTDDGTIPNHPRFPLLVYAAAFPRGTGSAEIRDRFEAHGWGDTWVNGVFDFHHFHSNAHEVLGCFAGEAEILFGGEQGVRLTIRAGDAVVIPAGVGHQRLSGSADFGVVGAYPQGQDRDLCRGDEDSEVVRARVRETPRPSSDPVAGPDGPLLQAWPA